MSIEKVPVTIITGFLGSGKTTLVRHLMLNPQGRRLAVLVNEFGDLGIDGDILKGCADANCPEDAIVELTNGCLCCTVADDFVPTIAALLNRAQPPDHILIETSGPGAAEAAAEGVRVAGSARAHHGRRRDRGRRCRGCRRRSLRARPRRDRTAARGRHQHRSRHPARRSVRRSGRLRRYRHPQQGRSGRSGAPCCGARHRAGGSAAPHRRDRSHRRPRRSAHRARASAPRRKTISTRGRPTTKTTTPTTTTISKPSS